MTVIHVTEEDIQKGCQGDAHSCPIARAIERQLDVATAVSQYKIMLFSRDHSVTLRQIVTPVNAQQFISDFDKGNEVKPFSFMLELP